MCERVVVGAPSPQQSSARIGGGCICSSSDRTEEIVFSSLMKIKRGKKRKLLRNANDQALCFMLFNFIIVYLLFCLRAVFFKTTCIWCLFCSYLLRIWDKSRSLPLLENWPRACSVRMIHFLLWLFVELLRYVSLYRCFCLKALGNIDKYVAVLCVSRCGKGDLGDCYGDFDYAALSQGGK